MKIHPKWLLPGRLAGSVSLTCLSVAPSDDRRNTSYAEMSNQLNNSLMEVTVLVLIFLCFTLDLSAQTITWQHVYDTPVSDFGLDGISSYNGGYVILYKLAEQFGGTRLLKLDAFGKQVSSSIVDSTSIGSCLIQTKDSGYVISGYNTVGRLTKLDRFFNAIWARSYFINNQQVILRKVIELPDGDFLACGNTSLFPVNAYVIRTDSVGDLKWQYQYTFSSSYAGANDICFSSDSSIYFTGVVNANGVAMTLICKLNSAGNLLWHRAYGTTGKGDSQVGLCIRSDNSQIFHLCGQATIRYSYRGLFIKIDSSGNMIYQKLYETADEYRSFERTTDGFFLCGTDGDLGKISLLHINEDGTEISNKLYGFGSGDDFTYMHSFRIMQDRGMLITGETSFPTGGDENLNIAVLKTDSSGSITSIFQGNGINSVSTFKLLQNYPNPFNSITIIPFSAHLSGNVKLTVTDIRGRIIDVLLDRFVRPGMHKAEFDGSRLASGVYFYMLEFEGNTISKKLLLLK